MRAVNAQSVTLQPLSASCSGCIGCGGRCSIFPDADGGLVLASRQVDQTLAIDDEAVIYIDEAELARQARRGYGLPLIGLLAGAFLGWLIASLLTLEPNLPTAIAAALGTLLGLPTSKQSAESVCRVRSAMVGPS